MYQMLGKLAKAIGVVFNGGVVSVENCRAISESVKKLVARTQLELREDLARGEVKFDRLETRLDAIEQAHIRLDERTKNLPNIEERIIAGIRELLKK